MASYADRLRGSTTAPEALPGKPATAAPAQSYSDRLKASVATPQATSEAITPQSSYEQSAAIGDIAVASLADDPQARAKFFAQQRGLPLERYRIVDDRVAYQDDDGQWYYERPNAQLSDPRTWFQSAAGGVGPSMPVVAGGTAGVLTAPMLLTGPLGMAGSIGLTGAAGAGGQAAREALAEEFLGQEPSAGRILQQGAVEGLSQGVGGGLTSLGQRHVARDIAKLDRPAATSLTNRAAARGVQLTPAEATNLPSAKARQKMLGNMPESADTMADFYERRAGQIARAVDQELARISSVESPEVAGQMARAASRGAMERLAENRAAQAGPLYRKAFESPDAIDVRPVIQNIDRKLNVAKGGIKDALQRARSLLRREVQTVGADGQPVKATIPENRLEALHQAKMALDDMIEGAGQSGMGNTAKRQLIDVKNDLLRLMDSASPDYLNARAIFADLSPGVNRVREGVLGIIADLPETQLQRAAAKLFNASSVGPREVRTARAMLQKEAPEAWQAIKRAWLEDQWLTAGKETLAGGAPVNQGARFRKLIFGNPKQARNVEAMLEPAERAAWSDLGEILEAAGRVKPIGSDTAWNQEMMKAIRQESSPWVARVLRYITVDVAREISDRITEWSLRKNAARMADAITSPDAIQKLRELKQMKLPGAVKRVLVGHVLGLGGTEAAAEAVAPSGVVEPIQ